MNKVELLAPAGNYECLLAAVSAGADAVYLGGDKFGARAFADNFTTEELIQGIHYAHLFGVRIYLTVNTLVKEKEFTELFGYLEPLYYAGLDGVIVQDIGVFQYIREHFPKLELHASTQMTITGIHGAGLLKEMGAVRIVPSRELSIEEVREIHENVDIEIECFIHGAMCYCYSGQCLFSSILGGRSGNRGRCAQPCRLPYQSQLSATLKSEYNDRQTKKGKREPQKEQREQYPLSLKDMCTIENVSDLIEAGITSFKIEGRMKSPLYVAGVTAIYRRAIDQYYRTHQKVKISSEDMRILNTLYIRSERHNGYYGQHNGRNMITLDSPAYASCDDKILEKIKNLYCNEKKRLPVQMYFYAKADEPMILSIEIPQKDISVCVEGSVAFTANNRPMEKADFEKQLCKTKDTDFEVGNLAMEIGSQLFVPVKAINELRRNAFDTLSEEIKRRDKAGREQVFDTNLKQVDSIAEANKRKEPVHTALSVYVTTKEQFLIANEFQTVQRIYLDYELAKESFEELLTDKELYLALPFIYRKRSEQQMLIYRKILSHDRISGVLVRNLDELGWLSGIGYQKAIQLDAGVYVFNHTTKNYYESQGYSLTTPYELNRHELSELLMDGMETVCYGRIPMMITANCIYKTYEQCRKTNGNRERTVIRDRYGKEFPVYANCSNCYNIIYNSTVMSLHKNLSFFLQNRAGLLRIQLLEESKSETLSILETFESGLSGKAGDDNFFSDKEFTYGHFKRGVD